MNTPHKFRVWNGEEMHEPPHRFWMRGDGRVTNERHGFGMAAEDNEQYEVMFATGLTDAEGNEIWEGDIVDWADGRGVVYWNDDKARYLHGFAEKIDGDFNGFHRPPKAMWDRVRVIGNRYEDPNLLEGSTA